MLNKMLAILVMSLALLVPDRASACSRRCGDVFAPLGTERLPAHLPANGVFVSAPTVMTGATILVVVERAGVETPRSVAASRVLEIPDVEAGDRVRVSVARACDGAVVETVLEVTPAAPIPTTLGTLSVEAPRRTVVEVRDDRGSCTSDLAVSVAPFTLVLDPSLEPWRDALIEDVIVDDAPWVASNDPAVGARFVYAACEEPSLTQRPIALTEGAHRLRIDVRLRGVMSMVSNEEAFVLSCAIPPGTDAAVMSDGSLEIVTNGGSCSVTHTHRGPSIEVLAVLAMVLAGASRRARRTSSSVSAGRRRCRAGS